MNTDKLMELERKWPLDRHPDPHTDAWTLGYLRAKRECADELAAALRAEQAVGDEQRARELLAEELDLMSPTLADDVRAGNERKSSPTAAALRAIARALGTARQSEGMVPVPREPTEAMFAAALPLHQRMGQFKLTMIWNAMLAAAPGGEGDRVYVEQLCRECGHATMHMGDLCFSCTKKAKHGPREHKWDRDGERCVHCGDKDWMGGECIGPPATQPERDGRGNG